MNLQKLLSNCVIYLLTHSLAFAQSPDTSITPFCISYIETRMIHSAAVADDFKLYVRLPDNYSSSTNKYPVLYMTDGDWNMTVAMNCFSMLRQDYFITEPIIVGIGYGKGQNKRTRDLNPYTGGPKFLEFIEKEVMPWISGRYRTTNEKAIYGYSLGGMFTTYVLFNRPELFNMVFIGAPGNYAKTLLSESEKYFTTHNDLNAKVYAGVGEYERDAVKNLSLFQQYIESKECKNLIIETGVVPKANHGSGLAQVMQEAIAFGYCKKPKAIDLSPTAYKPYLGVYTTPTDSTLKMEIFEKDRKLYLKTTFNETPFELFASSKKDYFIEEMQKTFFSFEKDEQGKPYIIFINAENKQLKFFK
ncbi:alpha/beta hydrolase [Solitalea canadensis]|nr:alpha/beta hydrolase-fold protein [Solitalea canadensis]